ncbi:hypothetical protein ACJX0J_021450, partial [Zea mays]
EFNVDLVTKSLSVFHFSDCLFVIRLYLIFFISIKISNMTRGAAPTSAPGRRLGGTCTQGSSLDVVAVRRASVVACPAPPRMPPRSVSRSTQTEHLLGFMLFFDLTLVHLGQYFTKVFGMIGHLS